MERHRWRRVGWRGSDSLPDRIDLIRDLMVFWLYTFVLCFIAILWQFNLNLDWYLLQCTFCMNHFVLASSVHLFELCFDPQDSLGLLSGPNCYSCFCLNLYLQFFSEERLRLDDHGLSDRSSHVKICLTDLALSVTFTPLHFFVSRDLNFFH